MAALDAASRYVFETKEIAAIMNRGFHSLPSLDDEVGRHRRAASQHLRNVSEGIFP